MRVDAISSGPTSIAVIEAEGAGIGDLREEADKLLVSTGAVLFRGLGVHTPGDFHDVAGAFGAPFTTYAHGNSPRSSVGVGVWTSTEYPAEFEISLHNELSYAAIWPDRLFFTSVIAAETGGATPVTDGRALLEGLDPDVRERFVSRGVCYLQTLHGGFGPGKSWQQTYETDDRSEVEELLRSASVDFAWTADGDLRTRQLRPAVRHHPVTGESVWFNQAEQWHVTSLPAEQAEALLSMVSSEEELPLHATYGDGSPIPDEDLANVRAVAKGNECFSPWRPGEVLMIDNYRVLHGRHAYTGARKTLVAMI
ncbi:TauD/TfdA family dioxygenase [Rhizohabitans arisaemae]|uniref:TauD/TfdA family dioxygenase n=1 Tax=Rhizohabitans arisaemae TaxID=2720610 RepID=UPI0024B06CCC|nr:TauD/TfdA family dioxygenase [Rhizohabitans arisaemae]